MSAMILDQTRDPRAAALQGELHTGERVLWQGLPRRRVSAPAFLIWVFAVPWTAFALFWTAMASMAPKADWGAPEGYGWLAWAFPLFGLPFVLVGLAMLAAPFWPALTAGRRLYALTDRRIIALTTGRRLKVESYRLNRLGTFEKSVRRDGSGSLRIAIGTSHDSDGDRRTDYLDIGEIADVAVLERQLEAAMARLSSGSATRS